MQKIVSGTSTERVVRTLLLMLFIDGFTVAYLWDGYIGYARQNANELVRLLGLPSDTVPSINTSLTVSVAQKVAQEVKAGNELSAIFSTLGQPSLEHGGDVYFLGPGGWLKVQLNGSRIAGVAWTNGPKTESDQQWQRWIGYALAVVGLIVAVRLALVSATRLTLSDAGLQVGGRLLIPMDAITDLKSARAGCVDLAYLQNTTPRSIRLDGYVYKQLPKIVAMICERKGYSNPWATATTATGRA